MRMFAMGLSLFLFMGVSSSYADKAIPFFGVGTDAVSPDPSTQPLVAAQALQVADNREYTVAAMPGLVKSEDTATTVTTGAVDGSASQNPHGGF